MKTDREISSSSLIQRKDSINILLFNHSSCSGKSIFLKAYMPRQKIIEFRKYVCVMLKNSKNTCHITVNYH